MEDGLVRETGKYRGKPGAGRMATGLEIVPDYGLVLGIEIQTERFRWVLADLEGKILYSGSGETEENPERFLKPSLNSTGHWPRSGAGPERIIGIRSILSASSIRIQERSGSPIPRRHAPPSDKRENRGRNRRSGIPGKRRELLLLGQQAFSRARVVELSGTSGIQNIDLQENRRTGFAFGVGIVTRDTVCTETTSLPENSAASCTIRINRAIPSFPSPTTKRRAFPPTPMFSIGFSTRPRTISPCL